MIDANINRSRLEKHPISSFLRRSFLQWRSGSIATEIHVNTFAIRLIHVIVIALMGLASVPPSQAVQLNPGGQGQVLLYPYYSVHNQQQTLLSIINTSDVEQVLQVTFREALNGRSALQFKIWLGRHDTWTGTVFALADDGMASDGAAVLTRDRTCTTPMFSSGSLTSGGATYFPLGNQNYSGAMNDGGPSDLGRARHGWIEVISLANVYGLPATAMTFSGTGFPANCSVLQNFAFGPDNLARPSGGLAGAASVIRVAAGTILSSRAEALSGFTEISLYNNDPMQPAPDLASVNEGTLGGPVSATVFDDQGHRQVLTYGTPGSDSRPIDAVSAALMATRVKNEYQTSVALAAGTDWVVTMPTMPFYTDPAITGNFVQALPPFERPFLAPGNALTCTPFYIHDQNQLRDSGDWLPNTCGSGGASIPGTPTFRRLILFQASNVIGYTVPTDADASPLRTEVLFAPAPAGARVPDLPWHIRADAAPAGWLEMYLSRAYTLHRLPFSAEGKSLDGLPAIGYSASNIVNGNVSNGVLANYAAAARHATAVSCVKDNNGTPCS